MKIVREYTNREEFEKGINEESGKGWTLSDWQIVVTTCPRGYIIIAVFVGRR